MSRIFLSIKKFRCYIPRSFWSHSCRIVSTPRSAATESKPQLPIIAISRSVAWLSYRSCIDSRNYNERIRCFTIIYLFYLWFTTYINIMCTCFKTSLYYRFTVMSILKNYFININTMKILFLGNIQVQHNSPEFLFEHTYQLTIADS